MKTLLERVSSADLGRAPHDQTGDPSRARSVWPETSLTSVERTPSICELPDPVGQF